VFLIHEVVGKKSAGDMQLSTAMGEGHRLPRQENRQFGSDISLRQVASQNWRELLGAGGYCAILSGCRNTWNVALPLQAHNLGLSKASIGLVVAIFRCCDAVATVTLAGHVMDRFGRKAAAIPTLVLMAVAFALLPLTRDSGTLICVVLVYALGNGLSGGILNYFATALAPAHARTQFLGLWKTITSMGQFVLPPLFGAITDITGSMKASGVTVAGVAIFAAVWMTLIVNDAPRSPARAQALAPRSQERQESRSEHVQLETGLPSPANNALT